jgi:hypothetical protein
MNSLRVGFYNWHQNSDIISLMMNEFQNTGCKIIQIKAEERLPNELDVVLACGPFGSLVPVAQPLLSIPRAQRPVFVLWMTEQLPDPAIPHWVQYPLGLLRTQLERWAYQERADGVWTLNPRFRKLAQKATRFRYYGDLYWLNSQGVLSVLAVGSQWIADYLKARNIDTLVAYIGSNPAWGSDLNLERDIPVLWIGKMGTDRRKKLLDRLRVDLRGRGVEVLVIDGVEHPYVFGQERTILLNRSKIVINLLREKWDNHSLRYFLAAQNKAAVVTEPTYPHTPFQPGVHLIQSGIDDMANTIYATLANEDERSRIAANAHQLVMTELTMRRSVEKILEKVHAARKEKESL